MLVFASTNDSVQFHEAILRTFINRKFSLYLDNDGDDEVADMDVGSDIDEFIANEDDDSFELNLKKGTTKKPKKLAGKKTTKIQKKSAPTLNSGNNLIDVFALYGNMEQHKRADILSKYCQSDSGILICTVAWIVPEWAELNLFKWVVLRTWPPEASTCPILTGSSNSTRRPADSTMCTVWVEPLEWDTGDPGWYIWSRPRPPIWTNSRN